MSPARALFVGLAVAVALFAVLDAVGRITGA